MPKTNPRILIEVWPGNNVGDIARKAVSVAWQTCETVWFTFNGVTIGVHMGAELDSVFRAYDENIGKSPVEIEVR